MKIFNELTAEFVYQKQTILEISLPYESTYFERLPHLILIYKYIYSNITDNETLIKNFKPFL